MTIGGELWNTKKTLSGPSVADVEEAAPQGEVGFLFLSSCLFISTALSQPGGCTFFRWMGCSHSKTMKKTHESRKLAKMRESRRCSKESASSSRKEQEGQQLKTGRETEKKSERRKEKPYVWRKDEVSPLPPDPPNFTKEDKKENTRKKRREKDLVTAAELKGFAEEDKEAFLADRKQAKETRRKQLLSQADDDTLFEQPTRMPDCDFTQDGPAVTSSG